MSDDKFAEIRARHAQSEKNYIELEATWKAQVHEDRAWLLAEVERLRGERDTLLLDARDFLRWFNRHYPEPSGHPDHPWCAISSRLDAYADTLKTFDSGVETKEAKP